MKNPVNSFWASLWINSRRRVWVWALSVFSMIMVLPGILTVQFTRIDSYNVAGSYYSRNLYIQDLMRGVLDTFRTYPAIVTILLAIVIGIQGFSYLFSKRKIDMYLSIPVSNKRRFATIYFNGIFIYLCSLLLASLVVFIMIVAKGIANSFVFIRMGLSLAILILLFGAVYNITVLAVSLTGNLFMATVLDGAIIVYPVLCVDAINSYMSMFFNTRCTMYTGEVEDYSLITLCGSALTKITEYYAGWDGTWPILLKTLIGVLLWLVIAFALAYSNYNRRPAEAAGKSVVFYSTRMLIKIFVTVPLALLVGQWTYYLADQSVPLMVVSLILSTVVLGILIEISFNMDFMAALRHWGSLLATLIIVMCIFVIFKWDIFRYDAYIPDIEDVSSVAVINSYESYYTNAYDFDANEEDYSSRYIDAYRYAKDHMFIPDIDAVLTLARKSQEVAREDMKSALPLDIYYRLASGGNRSRTIWVDLDDPDNDVLLNRIVGPAHYKEGIWQAMTTDIPSDLEVNDLIFYYNDSSIRLSTSEADSILKLWRQDMAAYDFDRVHDDIELGYIDMTFDTYESWNLPVYECYTGLMTKLIDEYGLDIDPVPASAIERIVITYYGDDGEIVREYSSMTDKIRIMSYLEHQGSHSGWQSQGRYAEHYSVEIDLTADYISRYNTISLYSYSILKDTLSDLCADIGFPMVSDEQ